MVERWSAADQKDLSYFNFAIKPSRWRDHQSIIALSQSPLFHYSIIPIFLLYQLCRVALETQNPLFHYFSIPSFSASGG